MFSPILMICPLSIESLLCKPLMYKPVMLHHFSTLPNKVIFLSLRQWNTLINHPLLKMARKKYKKITGMIKKHLEKVPKVEAGQILYYFFEDSGLLGHYLDPGSIKTEK